MKVNVPDAWKPFIKSKMRSGHYRSEDDVLDEALRLLKQRDAGRAAEIARVESLLIEGLDSGPATPMTSADWGEIEHEGREIIAARKARKLK